MERPDVFIVAAEPSGDQLGAALIDSLRSCDQDIRIAGIGGSRMSEAGVATLMSTDGLAVLGFVEGLKAYPTVLRKVREATSLILEADPRAVILIDSWGFMARIAKRLKSKGFVGKIVKYVAPQVWATRPGRAKVLALSVDHLLSTQTMDAPYFDAAGLAQTFVGNPVLDRPYGESDARAFREHYDLETSPIIGLFPGSRGSEIDRVGPAIVTAAQSVHGQYPDVQFICVVSDAVQPAVEALMRNLPCRLVDEADLNEALSMLDVAIACSGTITTQLAAAGVPTVVLYRLSALTYAIASRIFRQKYISLVNISADAPLMPEYLQDEIMDSGPADVISKWLDDPNTREALGQSLKRETQRMGAGSGKASDRAAAAILDLLH
ncbi:MAG: lipid-A-disaccharide synthase [Litorimonas sp.]